MAGGICGGGMHGRLSCVAGHVWQERRPLQQTVRILLECILVKGLVTRNVTVSVEVTVKG